jgi:hypothetical protein
MAKATGDIEVIAVLDGYWPNPPLKDYPNLTLLHRGEGQGMRPGINSAAAIARGKYLMKLDAHCLVEKGFDEVLQKDCEEDWVVIPTKYSLDEDNWRNKPDKPPVNYYFLTFPYHLDGTYGTGLHAKTWNEKNKVREAFRIDDLMSFQGSFWFMHKTYFDRQIGPLDHDNYYFVQEAQEIGMKCWLSGGRVVINKNTSYAHLHKGKKHGRGYFLSTPKMVDGEVFSTNYWMNDQYPNALPGRGIRWIVEKFGPLPGWPGDWQDPKYREAWIHRFRLVGAGGPSVAR